MALKNKNIIGKPGPGRKKGSKDKIPRSVKERVIFVWDQLEKEGKGLKAYAEENPKDFYKYFIRSMLPKEIDVKGGLDISVTVNTPRKPSLKEWQQIVKSKK